MTDKVETDERNLVVALPWDVLRRTRIAAINRDVLVKQWWLEAAEEKLAREGQERGGGG